MSEQSRDGYFIRFDSGQVIFPDICPVCSTPADAYGSVYLYEYNSDALIPTMRALNPDRLRIPTCEEHAYTENEIANSKSLRAALLGMTVVIFLYLTLHKLFLTD